MSTKHTPGPWSIDPKRALRVVDSDDQTIGSFGASDMIRDSWEANARLCAAAPDLLEALEELRGAVIDLDQDEEGSVNLCEAAIRKARIAIAKARGEK